MNISAKSRSATAKGPRIAARFCKVPNFFCGGCRGFCCICWTSCPNPFAVGVKARKTRKNVNIPTAAPAVMSRDQGEIRSKTFGPPISFVTFIVNASRGPKMIVRTVNICTVRTYLGNIFKTISLFA